MPTNDLRLPPISDNYRWNVKVVSGILGTHYRLTLQKRRLFWWRDVYTGTCPLTNSDLSRIGSEILEHYIALEDAKSKEGNYIGNPEYRKK